MAANRSAFDSVPTLVVGRRPFADGGVRYRGFLTRSGASGVAALFRGGDIMMSHRQQMCCALFVAQFNYNVNRGH